MNALIETSTTEMAATDRDQPTLNFAFAKRHGVLLQGTLNGRAFVIARQDVSVTALAEIRRVVGLPLELRRVENEEFDQQLRSDYEAGNNTMQAMVDWMMTPTSPILRKICPSPVTCWKATIMHPLLN